MKLASEELVYSHSAISPDTKTLMQVPTRAHCATFEHVVQHLCTDIIYDMHCFLPSLLILIHRQRQTISLIPVHEVMAQWNKRQFRYWVFGYDNSAHCPEYPNKCDCDCTVL